MRVAVVGHVEWLQFARVDHLPRAGEIVHARDAWEEAAGGGAVAAVQMAKLGGETEFFCALGDDDLADRSEHELIGRGVALHAARRSRPQRRAFCHTDSEGERTITVIGDRLVPGGGDTLRWDRLAEAAGVYFTGGDPDALRAARQGRVLVATPRASETLAVTDVELDALVLSQGDPAERAGAESLRPAPRLIVYTQGKEGGRYVGAEGATGSWRAAELPGPMVDAYGCGDSFAAGLTFGLAEGRSVEQALELAARCGAWCMTGRGPYGNQLTAG
jgi:ribokinase